MKELLSPKSHYYRKSYKVNNKDILCLCCKFFVFTNDIKGKCTNTNCFYSYDFEEIYGHQRACVLFQKQEFDYCDRCSNKDECQKITIKAEK